MKRPIFIPLAGMIVGMAAAGSFGYYLPAYLLYILFALLIAVLFIRSKQLFGALFFLFFVAWGNLSLKQYLLPELHAQHIANQVSAEKIILEGVVAKRPEATVAGSRIYIDTERIYKGRSSQAVTGRILVNVGEGSPSCMTGDRVRLLARIKRPANYGMPGEFDYVRFLAFRKIYATAYLPKASHLVLIKSGVGHPLQRRMDLAAKRIGEFISLHAGKEGGILRALIVGDRGGVSKDLEDAYTRSGVNHILSISGFHLGIIALCLFQVILFASRLSTWFMLHANPRRFALLMALPPLAAYLLLTGSAPATIRSFIMIAICIAALSLERETETINSLVLAAALILIGSPAAIYDISFQLSFLALWGMVVLTPIIMRPFEKLPEGGLRWGLAFAAASCGAIAATLVPVAFYFQRATLTGLISNFLIVPLMGYGAVILGVAAIPLCYVASPVAALLVKGAAWLVGISNITVIRLAGIPILPAFSPSWPEFALSLLLLSALTFIESRRRQLAAVAIIGLSLVLMPIIRHTRHDERLTVTFFSIGQGESTLVTFPDGRRMLIDGGGTYRESEFDVGGRLLVPALRGLGVDRIDYLVLSHSHPDHILGLKEVTAQFPVGEFWESGRNGDSSDYRELRARLGANGVPVRVINADTPPISIAGVSIEPLAPFTGGTGASGAQEKSVNEDSLAFRLSRGTFSLLFTGDIGIRTEETLLGARRCLQSKILKVAHHGSRHSSSSGFLRAVAPEVALISAGRGNRFGLPHEESLQRLESMGISVYRSDIHGTIELSSDDKGFKVVSLDGQRHFR